MVQMRGSRNFHRGGGGGRGAEGPGQSDKKALTTIFLVLRSNGQFQRNLSFFKAPEGGGGCPIAYSL